MYFSKDQIVDKRCFVLLKYIFNIKLLINSDIIFMTHVKYEYNNKH